MADATLATTETSSGAVGGSPGAGKKTAAQKKAKGSTAASARSKPSHPPTSEMVDGAIKSLKERGGSSLQAIKKYVAANYKVDAEKLSPFIKKYLKSAVVSGALVQTKGKGASGSFKLAGSGKQPAGDKASKRSATKPSKTAATAAKRPKIAKKAVKKSPKGKKSATPAAPKTPAKAKTPSKAKKTTKVPTKKPKAPKPKKAKPAASKPSPAKKTPKRK